MLERWLNLRKFFPLAQISKNKCQITLLSTIELKKLDEISYASNSARLLRDLSQSEKLSKIKPPLSKQSGSEFKSFQALIKFIHSAKATQF